MAALCVRLSFLLLWPCACLQNHQAINAAVPYDTAQLADTSSLESSPKFPCTKSVWWLHIPKTGTSFGQSTHSCVQYPYVPRPSYHTPVQPDASPAFVSKVVGMFRRPDQRLASELGHIKKIVEGNLNSLVTFQNVAAMEISSALWGLGSLEDIYRKLKQGYTPANDEFLGIAMQGCQTRMLNGEACFSETTLNSTHVELATQKINTMLFVGLQEEWFLSICLFNRIVTGKPFAESWQLANGRPTIGSATTEYDTAGYPKDESDTAVYAAAKARFKSDLKKYGITTEACSQTYFGQPL